MSDNNVSVKGSTQHEYARTLMRTWMAEDAAEGREQALKLASRITNYLGNGGFWNPEMMEHDKVRDLLMDCRTALVSPQGEAANFILTLDECKALNFFLRLHGGLMKEHEEQYTQILRLINGIGQFVDKHDDK